MKKLFLLLVGVLFFSCNSVPEKVQSEYAIETLSEQTNQEESVIHKDYWYTSFADEDFILSEKKWAEENPLHKFRGYEWGTRLDVVLQKEGKPDDQYFYNDTIYGYINRQIETYHLVYETVSAAGYEWLMEISFYNDALFSAIYNSNIKQEYKGGAYKDLSDKLTLLYGEPDETKVNSILNGNTNNRNNSYTANWNNIRLRCSDYDPDSGSLKDRAYVIIEYTDHHKENRIKDDWENEVKLMKQRADQRKDTSGL